MVARRTRGSGVRWTVAAGAAALAFGWASPALAHDTLISSDPADEEVLDSSPEEITLTYNAEIMDVGAAVTVVDSDHVQVPASEVVIEGTDAILPLDDELEPGGYAVLWRVVSSDGHPISGAFTFSNGSDGPPPPDPSEVGDPEEADQAGEPAEAEEDTETSDEADEAATQDTDADDAAEASDSGMSRVLLLVVVGAALGLAVFAVARFVARRKKQS
ncbi:copper resistance protein CopC [Spiractinospora alimapuensis]|uniref:copper resistance CopC family protein n=1 Tax=Spiractinospora alimapuensis TaxID=2820884 RepID=UPI001F23E318|nr:copper resistance CopC family protein [Spiractinospora alimapuensis]QVQ50811.1 copper resistance protein CopC [Spiractinospora alimapuensis]